MKYLLLLLTLLLFEGRAVDGPRCCQDARYGVVGGGICAEGTRGVG